MICVYLLIYCTGVFIVGAKRTPFCSYGGPLRHLPASHVFAAAAKEAIRSANVDPNTIDNTVVGNVNFVCTYVFKKKIFVGSRSNRPDKFFCCGIKYSDTIVKQRISAMS